MSNKSIFQSFIRKELKTQVRNEAGGVAYRRTAEQQLAQYAAVGCFGSTFYSNADEQLVAVLARCNEVSAEFIAQTALFARQQAHMKDMPALLVAVLSVKSPGLMAEVFERVIDKPKMLRNFVQIMRSGVVGRRSLGTLPKRLVEQWFESRSDEQLFYGSVGNDPSLADVIKMVHPKPLTETRQALFQYLLGRKPSIDQLPLIVQQYERCKRRKRADKHPAPDVPMQMLTSLKLELSDWLSIARNASWQTTRMNLNTFERHGVFKNAEMVDLIAKRLSNVREIERAKVFPYQLLSAYLNVSPSMPIEIRESLQDAMEIAISNVPHVEGKVFVLPDVSGSMHSSITGERDGATSKVRCIDVAALVAAAILRRNPKAEVVPFATDVIQCKLNSRDSVMTNAERLAGLPSGGTNCSAPLTYLNKRKAMGELIVYVSDNESWIDSVNHGYLGGRTETMKQWEIFKNRNPYAKMICIDIQPHSSVQAKERPDIINVGGFSDQVFRIVSDVATGRFQNNHWVETIRKTRL